MAKAIAASKRDLEQDQRRHAARERAVSSSPLRPIGFPTIGTATASRTLEAAAVQQNKKDKKKGNNNNKERNKHHQEIESKAVLTEQKKQHQTTKAGGGSPPRPTAPPAPIHYILQQSHFS